MTKKMKFKTPLVGRITRLKRTWWMAYVPAIGVMAQSDSRRGAASTLKGNIERMFRHERKPVAVAVTMLLDSVVEDGANVSVTCDRRGLLEERAAEFPRLAADVDGPLRNPFLVPFRRGEYIVANHVDPRLPARPTNNQRIEHMRLRVALVTEETGRTRRMPPKGWLMREATIHRLGIIGVAAAGATKALRAKYPSVPWADAIAIRKFLGKSDDRLDQSALRKAVRETVPALAKVLARPEFEAGAAKNPLQKPKARSARSAVARPNRQGQP